MSINSGTVYSELVLDTTKYNRGMDNAEKRMNSFASRMSGIGDKMTSVGNKMTMGVTLPILGVAAASFKMASDTNEAINKVNVAFKKNSEEVKAWSKTTLKNFGIASGTALDMAALFGDMATSMGLSTDKAADMSMSLVGLAGDLASFKNKSISEVTTALNGIFTGETESLKGLGVVMTVANLDAYALAKGIKKTYEEMTEAEKVNLRYMYVMEKTGNAHGDFKNTASGAANQMRMFQESLKELGATFGENLLPIITPFIQRINELVQKFGALDKETQMNIIKIAGLVAVVGPLTSGIGRVSGGIGNIISLGKKVGPILAKIGGSASLAKVGMLGVGEAAATAGAGTAGLGASLGAAGASLGAAAIAAGPWILAAGAVVGTGYLINKAMSKEAIPAVDLFADKYTKAGVEVSSASRSIGDTTEVMTTKISEVTKKAVSAYMDLDTQAQKSLDNLYVNSTKITKEAADSIVSQFATMGEQIKAGTKKRNSERLAKMQEFFAKSSTLTDKEEADALSKMVEANKAKEAELDNYSKRVTEIMAAMAKENREMTQAEQKELATIRENMKTQAVKALSEQEVESKVLLERMKSYGSRVTVEQAGEIIRNANKARDDSIAAANAQYDQTVAAFIRERDETGTLSEEQATKLIEEAGRQRDESINKAQELREGVVGKFKEAHVEIAAQVSDEDGSIKTGWSNLQAWFDKHPLIKTIQTNIANSFEPRPWVKNLLGLPDQNWTGTDYFKGGLTWVGEKGAELLELPEGTKIYNHQKSMEMARMAAGNYGFPSSLPVAAASTTAGTQSTVHHTGTIKVEGINSRGQLMEVMDLIVDELRRGART